MFFLFLAIQLVVYSCGRESENKVKGNVCEYKFIVQQSDATLCKPIIRDVFTIQDEGDLFQSEPEEKNINQVTFKLQNMESRFLDEIVKNRELNFTLARHEQLLQTTKSLLATFKSKFSKVFRAMMLMEQKFKRQRKVSRSLNQKLSNVVLDVVEVNNVLLKNTLPRQLTANDKPITVESVTELKSCSGYSDDITIYQDCDDAYNDGNTLNGVYFVKPIYAPCGIPVWCDMKTSPGGWLTFQRRQSGQLNFNRNWNAYKKGFGDVSAEFWLGNDNIFLLSNQNQYQLRIDLWDFEGNKVYALYRTFKIDGERDHYQLYIDGYSGTANDSLYKHNRMSFSTPDRDNDARREAHCAREWEGGWWFSNCWFAYLNGPFHNNSQNQWRGIAWNHWKREQLQRSEMKIRPILKP